MIEYHSENDFKLEGSSKYSDWLNRVIDSENRDLGPISYIYCDDKYLLKINKEYLEHDTLTDIITFDYSKEGLISGDIFISIERVKENALKFKVSFDSELRRVMCHGVLHLIGYNDKSDADQKMMRNKEDEKMKLFHVEQ